MQIVGGNKDRDKKRKEKDSDKGKSQRKRKPRDMMILLDSNPRNIFLLTESCSSILATTEGLGFIKFPKKTNKPMGRKKGRLLPIPQYSCHYTGKCQDLVNQIKVLIKKKELAKFVHTKA